MDNYKNLLTIKPYKNRNKKNVLDVWMEWDSNDADYIENSEEMDPSVLFENKKLIYCLAYINLNHFDKRWKGLKGVNDPIFGKFIDDNCDIEGLSDILAENDFVVYSDWGMCHSCEGFSIIYWDENGNKWDITFDDIYKEWENMSYKEICDFINSIEE